MSTVANFRKDIRAALVARLNKQNTSLVKADAATLRTELAGLMNEEKWQEGFTTEAEFEVEFRTIFKKEILRVATAEQAAPEKIAELEQLQDVEPEAAEVAVEEPQEAEAGPVMQVVKEEQGQQDEQEQPVMQVAAEPVEKQEEELTKPFYAVELQADAAVVVGFGDVDTARKYARRRTHSDSILTQVATRDQYRERFTPDSMLNTFNLLGKPYQMGEMTPASWDKPAVKPAAPVAAKKAPAAKPAAAKAVKKAQTAPATEASKELTSALRPAPVKRLPIPAEGSAPELVFSARLSHLDTLEQYHQLMEEVKAAGLQLEQKSNKKAVEYLSFYPSTQYQDAVCLEFRRAGTDSTKVESKVYLHALARYYQVTASSK